MARRIKIERRKLKEPDELVSTSERFYRWAHERRRPILYAILIAGVLLAATRGVQVYRRDAAVKAQNFMSQAMKLQFASPAQSQGQPPDAALNAYTELLRRYGNTRVAPLAKLQAGNILQAQGRYAEAAAKFTEILRSLRPDHPLKDIVLLSLATCYYEAGNMPQAIATAQKVGDDPNSAVRDYAAYYLVTWERERGQQPEAEKALALLKENFPESPLLKRLTGSGASARPAY